MSDPFSSRPGAVGSPPQHYGSPLAEQRALAAGGATVLLNRDVVAVDGADRLTWLDSLTSQRLTDLVPAGSAETLLLDPSGRIEQAIRVLDDGRTAWLIVEAGRGAGLAAFLERMRFLLRVEVRVDTDHAVIGTLGDPPIAAASPNGVPLVWHDPWREVVGGGHQYAAPDVHPSADWTWSETLVDRGRLADLDETPAAGELAAEALRIAAWRPRATAEADQAALPHELDWLRSAVHLSKGCYRGQETVAKVHNLGHPPRRLVLLHLDGSEGIAAVAGDEVRRVDDDAPVGRVTSAGLHHELGPIALALVKRSVSTDAPLVVVTADGSAIAAAQEVIVPPTAGAVAGVPRLARVGRTAR